MINKIGEILWYAIFVAPLITILLVYWRSKEKKLIRLILGLLLGLFISLILFLISLSIVFRNGLGPT